MRWVGDEYMAYESGGCGRIVQSEWLEWKMVVAVVNMLEARRWS